MREVEYAYIRHVQLLFNVTSCFEPGHRPFISRLIVWIVGLIVDWVSPIRGSIDWLQGGDVSQIAKQLFRNF